MSDQSSARLGLPYLAAGQLQKHVTLNESLTRLDALVQTAVQSRALSSPPAEAPEGALFILGGAGEGAWSGRPAGALMRRDMSGWVEVSAVEGQIAFVLDAMEIVVRGDGGWSSFSGGASPLSVERLGVGTTADEDNPFAAKLNKALWAARGPDEGGDGDLRFTFNKSAPEDVLSLLFQSAWSGRAEIGLVGSDDLGLKVSTDGVDWRDAFHVDRTSGRVEFARGATRQETILATTSMDWIVPDWARWIEVQAVGGGGAGGAGHAGPAGSNRLGGGGGGGGGLVRARLDAFELGQGSTLSIVVGAGGAASGQAGGASSLTQAGQTLVLSPGGGGGAAGSAGGGMGLGGAAGAHGGSSSATAAGGNGSAGESADQPGGGGAGGALSSDNTARTGGVGGVGGRWSARGQGGLSTPGSAGGEGLAAVRPALSVGGGAGAGGAANASGAGYPGGAGGAYGGAGGGGGAGLTAGGQGGAGAGGVVRLTVIG